MARMYCTSRIWAPHGYFQLKPNIYGVVRVRAPLSMLAPNQTLSKSFCSAPIMGHQCFSDTKVKVKFICGTRKHASNQPISSPYKKVSSAVYQRKFYLDTSITCGRWRAISTITLRIRSAVAVLLSLFIQLSRSAMNEITYLIELNYTLIAPSLYVYMYYFIYSWVKI